MNHTQAARERAAAMLGIAPESGAAAARMAFFQQLERLDFVPPPAWCTALIELDDGAGRGGFAFNGGKPTDRQLRFDIQQFCEQYWKLPPKERRQRFEDLDKRSPGDNWSKRHLTHLQKGLGVEAREFYGAAGLHATIAAIIQEVFVLPKLARANERNARLAGARDGANWRVAAKSFRKDYPQLASLDPDLLKRLEEMPSGYDSPSPVRHDASSDSTEKSTPGWLVYVVVLIVIAVIRAAGGSSSSRSNTSYNVPEFQRSPVAYNPYPTTFYGQSPSPYQQAQVEADNLRLRLELNRLVFDLRLQPSESAYRRLSEWLNSKGATVRSRPGWATELLQAEKCLRDYELLPPDRKTLLRDEDLRP